MPSLQRANVIGAGPNGLAAAIVLAQAGIEVTVYEAEAIAGGAARTLDLTLPGFHHDFGSAVHPMAAGSPFFRSLPLEKYGLKWIHPPVPLAHPLDDGTAVTLERDLGAQIDALGRDGPAWKRLFAPFVEKWSALAEDAFGPLIRWPRHPFLMARFGAVGFLPAATLARGAFRQERARALFAGLAAHSFLSLDKPLSAAVGLMLGTAGHAIGWPIPEGGAQSITNALIAHLEAIGGIVHRSQRVANLAELPAARLTLCDVTPNQFLKIAAGRISESYGKSLRSYRYGAASFKVDYALSEPIPWNAAGCRQAGTVHVAGTLEEVAASEAAASTGKHTDRPFVLVSQPTLFDPSRAPAGRHIVWAYCHVPHGSKDDATTAIASQIERFAPGFRDCVLARSVLSPARLESMDANLVGGDINGGAMGVSQFLFRPTRHYYRTSARDIYLCSSSTPPGGGVHGMCGYHAAKMALASLKQ
ncbi:Phytoene dehydrogenase [Acidisarcina polymorpha]|uniref:Phytoene dehydrogenase n=1 Tax=Acidisarcina polymorpha TaxID=2211140 RepID=A0A2Z5FY06_9BACT|nr:NAD(P)/FAD-dependent oxidoreductase [Acidisarcina polymorpha]AXC11769.1 Phytoene dehydrogenase [Acidisarcina polymorpha]